MSKYTVYPSELPSTHGQQSSNAQVAVTAGPSTGSVTVHYSSRRTELEIGIDGAPWIKIRLGMGLCALLQWQYLQLRACSLDGVVGPPAWDSPHVMLLHVRGQGTKLKDVP
ncbi:hypothetical protein JB92DRAFT_2828458 [Gautieria morchelliformis]|nr:hypothetical protein JB92DRAFT_2828458 [Gautieria morchelliformis]